MAFPSCDILTLNSAVPGSLQSASDKDTQAFLVLYLWLQQNPSLVGQTLPADTLLSQAKCFDCGVSDQQLLAYEVWLQRQAAIDAGAAIPAWDSAATRKQIQCLSCLPMHRLKAIEIFLRCQLS